MEQFVQLIIAEINRLTGFNDWNYVLHRNRRGSWAVLFRDAWNVTSPGPAIRHGVRNGQPARGTIPVIWFEIVFIGRRRRVRKANRKDHGGCRIANFVRLENDRLLGASVRRFHTVLQILQNTLILNPNPFSIEFLRHVVIRSIRNRRRRALQMTRIRQVAEVAQYIAGRFTLFDAQL